MDDKEVLDLERRIRDYCDSMDLNLSKEEILSVVGTLILEPKKGIATAVKRRETTLSWMDGLSLYEQDGDRLRHGKQLIEKIPAKIEESEEPAPPEICETDTLSIEGNYKEFIETLHEMGGSLIDEVVSGISSQTLTESVKEWIRGPIKPTGSPKKDYTREFVDFLSSYIKTSRYKWLSSKIGHENATKVLKYNSRFIPISTMEKNLITLRRLGSVDDDIVSYPYLLEQGSERIEANAQYLHSIGIDYHIEPLLSTRPRIVRERLAWMLRELFDYRQIPSELKIDVIHRLYDFIRTNPYTLALSMNGLKIDKDKLRKKVCNYRIILNH